MHIEFTESSVQYFWNHVEKSEEGCWTWTGTSAYRFGYGRIWLGKNGGYVLAHRFSYLLNNGPIPDGLCVCHACDNPRCVRPDHLWTGTRSENTADRDRKGRGVSWFALHPDLRLRGDDHPYRKHPELHARGDRTAARLHPETLARGEKSGNARLTDDIVREIRRAYAAGEADTIQLGIRFGVHSSTIGYVIQGKTWKHVT